MSVKQKANKKFDATNMPHKRVHIEHKKIAMVQGKGFLDNLLLKLFKI